MFCFVDSRNRPQYKYTFRSRGKAREYLRKSKIILLERRSSIPTDGGNILKMGFRKICSPSRINVFRIKRGCHIKYQIRPLAVLDGIAGEVHQENQQYLQLEKSAHFSSFYVRQPEIFGLSSD